MRIIDKTILLVLSFTNRKDFWMTEEYRKLGYEVHIMTNNKQGDLFKKHSVWGQAMNSLGRFMLGWKAHKRYAGESRVIFWNWESSFFFLLRDFLTFRRCRARIIALHLILLDTSSLKKCFWRIMFVLGKWHSGYCIAVNSEKERTSYAQKYHIPLQKIVVLPDSYERIGIPASEELEQVEPRSVFCGGCMRDFKTLLLVAHQLPDYVFNVIASKKKWNEEWEIPANVRVNFNTPLDFFYTCLNRSSILYLPLNRDEANGLIVLTKAALMRKPIIVTDTSCTRNYIRNNQNGIILPMGGVKEAVEAIKMLENKPFYDKLIRQMAVDIEAHSPLNYCKKILTFSKA
ncbi:glycosyltransferase [Parabacteroides sp.]|uniref:glycosyltransferase n=1 Tax=Parabacteroides sp. TaxID=1869337 RepID=UPI00257B7802|nr:glycosyltransferase [Parabacteroides sp.]